MRDHDQDIGLSHQALSRATRSAIGNGSETGSSRSDGIGGHKMASMSLLERIGSSADLKAFSKDELAELAAEIRTFLISNVSRTGGHLGPNLGVVELTIAIHQVFNSPHDPIIFDTGHQSYVHKILTGRASEFSTLRQAGGLSGYPDRVESEHDWVANSHASTALSWADGMAKAFRLRGEDRTVVAFVGDGSLTGGMAWEALNNIAAEDDLPLVIVVNDNGRSYTPTVGGFANHLSGLRTDRRYEKALQVIKKNVKKTPLVGSQLYDLLHGLKVGLKDWLAPQGMFSDLGIKYVGPIDGHDIGALVASLEQAKQFRAPVIVHCITRKGNGFAAAENHEQDRFHAVGQINELTGEPVSATGQMTWTDAFAEAMLAVGAKHPEVVAITAAMMHPTGLSGFASAFPERTFDVGIAEQHAMTSAAGFAAAGMHPVFAVYSTFLNRAFDQLLMDAALHRAGVTVVLDRSGVTGPDGASHHGVWDVPLLGMIPRLWLAAPRDRERLEIVLNHAIEIDDAPSVIRYSKERLPDPIPAVARRGSGDDSVDLISVDEDSSVLIVGYGQFAGLAISLAEWLREHGASVTVADPMWAIPLSPELVRLAEEHSHVVTIEDNLLTGGLGSRLGSVCAVPVHSFGIATEFLPHGTRTEVLQYAGLDLETIAPTVARLVLDQDRVTESVSV